MIPDEISKMFIEWAVTEVYDEWQIFAIETSIFAYNIAIKRAREESDARIAQMKDYIENLIEVHNRETKGESKDTLVYTTKPKDMR